MDALQKLSREAQVVLGGLVLFVIISFFDWQQASAFGFTVGQNLWHGFGVVVALVAVLFLAWEILRLVDYKIELGQFTHGMVSAALALVLLVFTVIVFLDWSAYRHWPEWVGLILAIAIGVASFMRAKAEGVEMPKMPSSVSVGSSGSTAASSPSAPAAPTSEPASPPEDAGRETTEA
jgi:hypothetical protein